MHIRTATIEDAAAVVAFFQQLYAESHFMLFEPGEAVPTISEQAQRIQRGIETTSGTMLLCEADNQLIGVCYGTRGIAKRTRHSLYIVLGVLQAWSGQGVGRLLMEQLEAWAREQQLHRLELMVQVDNQRAIALYEKLGFQREGLSAHSLYIAGRYVDEFSMAKLLEH